MNYGEAMSATPKSLSFLIVVQALILGCGGNNSNVPNPPSPSMPAFSDDLTINGTETGQAIEFQGVKFETPPSSDNPNDTNLSGNSVTFKWGGVSGEFSNGSLTIEGNWYGNIERGDIVTLGAGTAASTERAMLVAERLGLNFRRCPRGRDTDAPDREGFVREAGPGERGGVRDALSPVCDLID